MIKVMGIDPGIRVMGYGVICCTGSPGAGLNNWSVLEAGTIRSESEKCALLRVSAIHGEIFQLLEKVRPDHLIMESAFFGVNPQSALRLGEARGSVISAAGRVGTPAYEISPARVKKVITGSGRSGKDNVARSVEALLKISLKKVPFDVSDALAIALAGVAEGSIPLTPPGSDPRGSASGTNQLHME